MQRYEIINQFIHERNYTMFLEIGTNDGATYNRVDAKIRVSVDPGQNTPATFRMTSDEFFAQNLAKFDIVFIDGLHEHDQVYRDIQNALSALTPGGVIILHDCLPTSEQMQEHLLIAPSGYPWTGDVWKAFVKARASLPYESYTINDDFGCGVIDTSIKKSSPTSRIPKDMEKMTYDQFVKHPEWMNVKEAIVRVEKE